MEISICIVSKNRKSALQKTLKKIVSVIDNAKHEVFVFLDGCTDGSNELQKQFLDFQWFESSESIGASPARRIIFAAARGKVILGFDDDAHPLQHDFINKTEQIFWQNPTVGILTFEEIKGIFPTDFAALKLHVPDQNYLCNSFVGCGFAIRRHVYEQTAGFPEWMDIYGEEGCVSIETIDNGYDILYTSEISVNHRVDRQERKMGGSNIFRFERQLCHMALYFLVFYPTELLPRKLGKLFWHNFRKYAFKNINFFVAYFKGLARLLFKFKKAYTFRKPVSKETVKKINRLPHPKYG
ncbi:glycosyltransferase family 2 protein [Flavimarina sp. Hel_I_48]|uniref:glycosyltransferase family 2 protein n=1 Tax=Flavimarina sp. Hel_I_48 TaxID=1392488 RepID=UPI0004DEE525|nr:glycosyltransferase [Flavimarina sp. Hel_I_48]